MLLVALLLLLLVLLLLLLVQEFGKVGEQVVIAVVGGSIACRVHGLVLALLRVPVLVQAWNIELRLLVTVQRPGRLWRIIVRH